jgi:hypothetical protein
MDNICVKLQKNVQRYVDIEYRFILSKKKTRFLLVFCLEPNFLYQCSIAHKLVFGVYLNNVLEK